MTTTQAQSAAGEDDAFGGDVAGPREVPGHPDYRIHPDGRYECRRNQAGASRGGRWYPREHVVRMTARGTCSFFKFRNRETGDYVERKAVELIMELFGAPKPATRDIGGVSTPLDPVGLAVVVRVPDGSGRLVQHDHDGGNPGWLHVDLLAWGYRRPRAASRPARRRRRPGGSSRSE